MFDITPAALEILDRQFSKSTIPLRVLISPRGCTEPNVKIVPDTTTDNDFYFRKGNFTFILSQDLMEQTGEVVLDSSCEDLVVATQKKYRAKGCGACTAAAVNGGACGSML